MSVGVCLVWWPSRVNSCRCFRARRDLLILLIHVNAQVFGLQLWTRSHVEITRNANVTHGWIDGELCWKSTRPSFGRHFHPSCPVFFWPSSHLLPEGQLSHGSQNQCGVQKRRAQTLLCLGIPVLLTGMPLVRRRL